MSVIRTYSGFCAFSSNAGVGCGRDVENQPDEQVAWSHIADAGIDSFPPRESGRDPNRRSDEAQWQDNSSVLNCLYGVEPGERVPHL